MYQEGLSDNVRPVGSEGASHGDGCAGEAGTAQAKASRREPAGGVRETTERPAWLKPVGKGPRDEASPFSGPERVGPYRPS